MLLKAIECGEKIEDIVMFDTGWEFPEMYDHIKKVEDYISRKITILKPNKPFDYWLTEHEVVSRGTKEVRCRGVGWPSPSRRWCTREKIKAFDYYLRGMSYKKIDGNIVKCIGFAKDESERALSRTMNANAEKHGWILRFPLIEWDMDEKSALEYCYDRGFDWGGLYKHMNRVSCYCCPLQPLDSLLAVKNNKPELWARMLDLEERINYSEGKRFRGNKRLSEI
jgi:3'-phosphoadenosine 5'-phosphosulfate sulfotransferase (PAPS reductase)/FAD synthetase